MSGILSKMQAAHDGRAATAVAVPEYDTTWYFMPLTMAERNRIRKSVGSEDEDKLLVETLIHKAQNKDGSPVFEDTPETRKVLFQMDAAVMARVLTEADPSAAEANTPKND